MSFYAVAKGNKIGVFEKWNECLQSIKGYSQARYKKFETKEDALSFIQHFESMEASNSSLDDMNPDYYVYTDGSCYRNGKTNAIAGIGIYFQKDDPRNVSKQIKGKLTNNTAELHAILETFNIIETDLKNGKTIVIATDSDYAIKCATTYGKSCSENNWTKNMANKILVRTLFELYEKYDNVHLMYIKAHTNLDDIHSKGNEEADRLANISLGIEETQKSKPSKIYLDVPYKDKEIIKAFEGKWDRENKKWYITYSNSRKDNILLLYKSVTL
jgi:ribonuclease HI